MNRKLMIGIAAFLAVVGIALTGADNQAQAGFGCGGGLFAKHSDCGGCGGRVGLLARIHAKKASCAGPAEVACPAPAAPACPEPPPTCGGSSDCGGCSGGLFAHLRAKHAARKAARKARRSCCGEPAPEPCCEAAPAPCCEAAPAPCCEAAAPSCGAPAASCCSAEPVMAVEAGEEVVPGSVEIISDEVAPVDAPAAPVAE